MSPVAELITSLAIIAGVLVAVYYLIWDIDNYK
jgi:hypothetical protein